jgi:hypothetical protein
VNVAVSLVERIKQNNMKKIFLLIIITTFFSCNSYKRDKFYYRKDDKNGWINTFKAEVFYECLREGYQNDTVFKIIAKKDLFNSYDGFEFNVIDSAKILGSSIIKKMPKPYINMDNEDLKERNFISMTCLNYYASKELDSIAKKAFKEHLKKNKKDEIFWKNY